MYSMLGTSIDVIHAMAMALWGLGLPLLFCPRWPRLSIRRPCSFHRSAGRLRRGGATLGRECRHGLGDCHHRDSARPVLAPNAGTARCPPQSTPIRWSAPVERR